MKLIQATQLPGREPLILRPERVQGGLQALPEPSRAIVLAHAIGSIGHCRISSEAVRPMYDRIR
jgi:hypothetical protein